MCCRILLSFFIFVDFIVLLHFLFVFVLYAGDGDYLWCLLWTYLRLQSDARVLLSPVHQTGGVDYLWCLSGYCYHLYTGLEMLTTCDLYRWLTCKYRMMLRYCCHLYTGPQVLTTCDLYGQLTCDYRVQPGYCYHLYTGLKWLEMIDYLPPEMLRTRLEELCLQIKVRLEWSAVCHRVQEDFVFTKDRFWYTCRSGSGLSGQQCVTESRRILCSRKMSSDTHADQVRLEWSTVCRRVQEDFVFTKVQF